VVILDTFDKGVNSEIHALLESWDYLVKSIDKAWYLLDRIASGSFEFEKANRIFGYSVPNPCAFYARSYYTAFWCDFYNSSNYDINSYPYYVGYAQPNFASPSTILMLS